MKLLTGLGTKASVIFENPNFLAYTIKWGGMIIRNTKTNEEVHITGNLSKLWTDAINSAIDESELHALCKFALHH